MKRVCFFGCIFVLALFLSGTAQAKPKEVPSGTLVTATALTDGLTTVTVTGAKVLRIEFYAWDSIRVFQGNTMTVPVVEGRRFNFVFEVGGKEYYALIDDSDMKSSPAWFGPNIGVECTAKAGCALLITAR